MSNQRHIPPENLQGHRDVLILSPDGYVPAHVGEVPTRVVPVLPFRALKRTSEAYAQFWSSEAAERVVPNDWLEITTAFENFDEYLRCLAIYKKSRTATGSTGQTVINPAAAEAQRWLRLALSVFSNYGFDPRGRLQMGIGVANLGRPTPGGLKTQQDDEEEEVEDAPRAEPVLIKPRVRRG